MSDDAPRFKSTSGCRLFGVGALADKTCRCGQRPRALLAMHTPEEGARVVWLCSAHGDADAARGAPVQSLTRTCGIGPCGAEASHVAIVAVDGRPGVHAVSVCPEHILILACRASLQKGDPAALVALLRTMAPDAEDQRDLLVVLRTGIDLDEPPAWFATIEAADRLLRGRDA